MTWEGLIARYAKDLPVTNKTPRVTLKEGNTPLIEAKNLADWLGADFQIFLKYDGMNPTGSFKDRGMTLAISKAVEKGSQAVVCASTGNTSASAAAYSARAGIKCFVLIPEGNIALGKLSQALVHGAKVIAVQGNFDAALDLVKTVSDNYPITLVNSLNPYRIEGQKTAAFEVVEQLGGSPPDFHLLPVGNAGNITAYWKGYKEYFQSGIIKQLPKMLGFQAAGSAPIVLGHPVTDPQTIATAIKIGNPASWKQAVAARDESGGLIEAVTDEEIIEAYSLLASKEGVFCEPASAASMAGLIKMHKNKYFPKGAKLVLTLTGHGLKDPDRAIATSAPPVSVPAELEAVKKIMGL